MSFGNHDARNEVIEKPHFVRREGNFVTELQPDIVRGSGDRLHQ